MAIGEAALGAEKVQRNVVLSRAVLQHARLEGAPFLLHLVFKPVLDPQIVRAVGGAYGVEAGVLVALLILPEQGQPRHGAQGPRVLVAAHEHQLASGLPQSGHGVRQQPALGLHGRLPGQQGLEGRHRLAAVLLLDGEHDGLRGVLLQEGVAALQHPVQIQRPALEPGTGPTVGKAVHQLQAVVLHSQPDVQIPEARLQLPGDALGLALGEEGQLRKLGGAVMGARKVDAVQGQVVVQPGHPVRRALHHAFVLPLRQRDQHQPRRQQGQDQNQREHRPQPVQETPAFFLPFAHLASPPVSVFPLLYHSRRICKEKAARRTRRPRPFPRLFQLRRSVFFSGFSADKN